MTKAALGHPVSMRLRTARPAASPPRPKVQPAANPTSGCRHQHANRRSLTKDGPNHFKFFLYRRKICPGFLRPAKACRGWRLVVMCGDGQCPFAQPGAMRFPY
jgi:hypothetical protein